MTLRLVIEHSGHPQSKSEFVHQGGDISIGRGTECDWQIDDPEMFISRKHCIVTVRDGTYAITDSSRGGVFLDGAAAPLGAGNSARLEHGTRIRLGDIVLRVEIAAPEPAKVGQVAASDKPTLGLKDDDFFARKGDPFTQPKRPATLPEEFDTGRITRSGADRTQERPALKPLVDDPFLMDPLRPLLRPAVGKNGVETDTQSRKAASSESAVAGSPDSRSNFAPPRTEPPRSVGDGTPAPKEPASAMLEQPQANAGPSQDGAKHFHRDPVDLPTETATTPAFSDGDSDAVRVAFFRGLGLDPAAFPPDGPTVQEMEALGRRFRLMADGLVHLLRMRTKEKGSVRVAQTVIGNSDVNPLKFLATSDDALGALVTPRGKGYLPPDEAITAAYRDLSDHQVRTWIALQSALRGIIDRFDPLAFEQEADAAGTLKAIFSGGRAATLWQLYSARYREIAKAAEDRFLGEVGADFRDAYEGRRRGE